jgi:diguanylate cyclase (GGDEF)-like protein
MCRKRKHGRVMTDHTQELARLRAALAASGDIAYDWNLVDDVVTWDGPYAELFGHEGLDALGTGDSYHRCINPQDLPERLKTLSDHLSGQRDFACEYRVRCGQGRFRWVQDRGAAHFSDSGRAVRLIGMLRAVDEEKQSQARLEYLATYDELTGLYNKTRLRDALSDTLSHNARSGNRSAYLVVGIDKLTLINDTFGYETGDAVIVQVGHRLERSLRAHDMIGRVGGDRFGIVLRQSSEELAAASADKMLCNVRMTPVKTPSGPLHVTVSVGVVSMPEASDSAHDLMAKAETALHEAKKQGRNCFISYFLTDGQREQRRKNIETAEKVRAALKTGRLTFAYQPIVDAKTGAHAYYECLVRMVAEDGRIVPAAEFVPVVEQMGMVRLVDRYALEMAVAELSRYADVKLAINISGLTVEDESWLRAFRALLADKPGLASRLMIEITETAAMQDIEDSAKFVNAVREPGCRVALDDFGAGYTSFRHFKSLTVDVVKIDGSFVHGVTENPDNQLFVHTLLTFAKGFGLDTVCECVETAEEAELLARQGAKYLQGYHCGRPEVERLWLPQGHKERIIETEWNAIPNIAAVAGR